MENRQIAPATSQRSLAISREGFDRACRHLDTERPVTGQTGLVPAEVCDQVIAAMSVVQPPIGAERGALAVASLLTAYPSGVLKQRSDGEMLDLKAYRNRMAKVFALYCEADCAAVLKAGSGLPSRLAFLPTEKELKSALDDEMARRGRIIYTAKAHKKEAERRAELARIDLERASMTPEERKARADAIRARLVVQTMDSSEGAAA